MENQVNKSKTMNILLWIAQWLLGIMFLMSGGMKLSQPVEKLATMMTWVNHVPPGFVKFVGLVEVVGALGLLLPSLLRIKPNLTIWAARGFIAFMLVAVIFHLIIGEGKMIGAPIVIGLIAAFIDWGRGKKQLFFLRIK